MDYRLGALQASNPALDDALGLLYLRLQLIAGTLCRNLNEVHPRLFGAAAAHGEQVLKVTCGLNDEPDNELTIFPEHGDFDLFTLFVGGAPPGLQVWRKHGWESLEFSANQVLVCVGTRFKLACPGVFATQHRVSGATPNRLAFALFVDLPPDTVLDNGKTVAEVTAEMRRRTFFSPRP